MIFMKAFIISLLNTHHIRTKFITQANCHTIYKTLKMIYVKHESSSISLKYNHCRALKDISEALEQLPSSKDISEAQRVF